MSGQQVRLTESLPEIINDYSLVQHIAKQYISIFIYPNSNHNFLIFDLVNTLANRSST